MRLSFIALALVRAALAGGYRQQPVLRDDDIRAGGSRPGWVAASNRHVDSTLSTTATCWQVFRRKTHISDPCLSRSVMRIGIISDTHDRQRRVEAAVDRFNRADLDLVIHAGDYVSPFVVPWLAALSAPLIGVLGNNDGDHALLTERFAEHDRLDLRGEFARIEVDGAVIALLHGHQRELSGRARAVAGLRLRGPRPLPPGRERAARPDARGQPGHGLGHPRSGPDGRDPRHDNGHGRDAGAPMTADLAPAAAAAALGRYTDVLALTEGAEDPALLVLRAAALDRMGRFPEALDCCSAAIAAAPLAVDAWFIQGFVLYRFSEFEQAAQSLEQALRLAPDHAEARFILGTVRYGQGRLDEAIACFEAVVAIEPRYAKALYNIGVALADQGQFEEALAYYDRVLAINEGVPVVLLNRGDLPRPARQAARGRRGVHPGSRYRRP